MAEMYIEGRHTSPSRAGEGTARHLRGTRDGVPFGADYGLALAYAGEVFVANSGTATTAVTFAGAYDADGPDMTIDVPSGTTIIPLLIEVHYESVGTTLLQQCIASVSNTLAAVTAGTAITPVNLRTNVATGSGCTVYGSVDAAGCTVQSGRIYQFMRHGFQIAEDMAATEPGWPEKTWKWSAKESGIYPILVGESSLFIHAEAQAGTGFITIMYAEHETAEVV